MKRRKFYLFVLGTIFLVSCNAPFGGLVSGIPPDGVDPQEDVAPEFTSSPTPFIPGDPDSTEGVDSTGEIPTTEIAATPTPDYPWGDFSPPARESAIEIPPPVTEIDIPPGVTTFVLLGSDEAPHRYGHRTDTIILVVLDNENDLIGMTSIPRDLYVYVPGWRVDRINTASLFGGWEMVAETFLYNFGIEPDFWVRVNFTGFEGAVNLLGGIEVEVGRYLNDECGGIQWEYFPGTHSMDGFTALCYVRMRKTTSDFDRLRRQQEVVEAIFRRVLTLEGLTRVPQLYSEFNKHYESNLGLGDILPLIPLATEVAAGNATVVRHSIDSSLTTSWIVPISGASVLLPDREGIQQLFQGLFEQ